MFCTDIPAPSYLILSSDIPHLLYYSHFFGIAISLAVSTFIFIKNVKLITARLLFLTSIFFSVWVFFDMITWAQINSRIIMFFWALMNLLEPLIFASLFYFSYTFIKKNDISLLLKSIISILLLPLIILLSSKINLIGFNIVNCEATQGNLIKYVYFLDILFSIWIVVFLAKSYVEAEKEFRKQIIYLFFGVVLFLAAFSWTNIIGNLTENWNVTQYGLFGMPVFMGFLGYLIVKFKAFNIKLIGAQALVYSLIILIGSQFFFIQNRTNQILTGITLAMAVGFGIFLIRAVKNEVQRKEELQMMAEKLAIANDQLRVLDNAKSEFISIASHQLRTPLTSIKGYVSLLLEGTYGKVDTVILDPLNKVYASNERLIHLVEELLNVSRIESGRMEYKFEKHKIENTIKDLHDTFSVIAKEKDLYIHLELPKKTLPEIEIDPSKTREIISNLIDNALKYTKRGGVTIKAEALINSKSQITNYKQDEGFVKVTVSDTGMGVPDTELPYLFSKFSRGKDTSRLHVGGTGLGLYVGKSMIEAQHGKIYVESEGSGKGSKFIIELPIRQPKG